MREFHYGRKALIVFFAITVALSALVETLIATTGQEWLYLPLMWLPAIAAFAAVIVSLRESEERFTLRLYLSKLGFVRCKLRYVLLGCLLPLIYLLVPYIIFWIAFPGSLSLHGTNIAGMLIGIAVTLVLGVFLSLISAIGEEIGWRGFMVPALYERLGLEKTLLISSLFWCCWHLPLLIFGDYMPGTPLWYQVPAFILCIFPVGVMAGILSIRTGSVWPAAFLHAAHNDYDQMVFGAITVADNKMYFVSETGVLTIVCAWILAIILYRREKKRAD